MKTKKSPIKVCIVSISFEEAFLTPLTNLIKIFTGISSSVNIIAGSKRKFIKDEKNFTLHQIYYKPKKKTFFRLINYIALEIKTTIKLFKIGSMDYCIFFNQNGSFLPFLFSRLLNKNTFWLLPSCNIEMQSYGGDTLGTFSIINNKICEILTDKILIYSPLLINKWNLYNHKNKILIQYEHFLNFDLFKKKNDLIDRENLIGYIGRLSCEKGIMNFIEAITILSKVDPSLKYLVIGSGPLKEEIEFLSKKNELTQLKILEWVNHEDMPNYLNKLKLIVIPSYTEGLPNVLIEAMACGTPILANPVGTIPEIIKDRKNGFLLKDNSSKSIANDIIKILNTPNLEKISENAIILVEKRFKYEKVLNLWKKIIN